jgi:Jacalin-like lectin domain
MKAAPRFVVAGALCMTLFASAEDKQTSNESKFSAPNNNPILLTQPPQGDCGTANSNAFRDDNVDANYRIVQVRVRHGKLIDAIQVIWKDIVSNKIVEGKVYGGGGGQWDDFNVDADQGEYLISMSGKAGKTVDAIGLTTNTGRKASWGGVGGHDFQVNAPSGCSIVGFFGKWGHNADENRDTLGCIGIAYRLN